MRERDQARERIQELAHTCTNLEYAKRSLEIEKGDLLDAYRAALQEKRKLENDNQATGYACVFACVYVCVSMEMCVCSTRSHYIGLDKLCEAKFTNFSFVDSIYRFQLPSTETGDAAAAAERQSGRTAGDGEGTRRTSSITSSITFSLLEPALGILTAFLVHWCSLSCAGARPFIGRGSLGRGEIHFGGASRGERLCTSKRWSPNNR